MSSSHPSDSLLARLALEFTRRFAPGMTVGRPQSFFSASEIQQDVYGRDIRSIIAGGAFTDPDEERDPPTKATATSFPKVTTPDCRSWNQETPPPDPQALFTRILKPADISEAHLRALNIELVSERSIEDLLPPPPDGSSYLPDPAPSNPPSHFASYANVLSTGLGSSSLRKDFENRLQELQADNAVAYRVITGNRQPGTRLAYMRTFWQGLENMSQYWDSTRDVYFAKSEGDDDGRQSPKRQKLDTSLETAASIRSDTEDEKALPLRTCSKSDDARTSDLDASEEVRSSEAAYPDATPPSSPTPPLEARKRTAKPRTTMRYKGFRTNTGRYMPDRFRIDTVRGFVEGALWPFKLNVNPPRTMPLVHFGNLKLPVRQTLAVYQLPADRKRATAGGVVGPVLGVQVRSDIDFDEGSEGKSRLDLMRELGGLLQLAQERAREGKTEFKPGEGKWWTTVPRWGGGPGGEMEEEEKEEEEPKNEIVEIAAELLAQMRGPEGPQLMKGGRPPRKKAPARLWRELRCGSGYFDPKTEYAAVGKDPGSDVDEVFLISSLNHHISILRLSVHRAYIETLSSGAMPKPPPQDETWCRPRLQRSRWFDLFDKEERVEAFRAVWAVGAYLTRAVGNGQGNEGAKEA